MINPIHILLRWFNQRRARRLPVLYCVHGYGVRRTVELDPLRNFYEAKGYQVVCVPLFDPMDELDNDPEDWFKRAEDGLLPLVQQHREIWLVGFSMGGVIASRLASKYPVKRLVLLAPAFEYVTLQTVKNVAEGAVRILVNKPRTPSDTMTVLPDSFAPAFRSIIASHKDSISEITQPVLFLHGSADEVIPVRSSVNAAAKIPHDRKLVLILDGVMHRILDDPRHGFDALTLIDDFFNGKLVPDPKF